jgi:branched-subunit amino acid transport protein
MSVNLGDPMGYVAIAGLTLITVVTRGFMFLSQKEWPLPGWLHEGLRYAPMAALVAVAVPETLGTQGVWLNSWHDAKLWGGLAALAMARWRAGVLGPMVAGMAVYALLRLAQA